MTPGPSRLKLARAPSSGGGKPGWQTLGRWAHAEGDMACRERRCAARRNQESCPARFASLRPVVPFGWWRTGADTIPPRPRIGSDDRALPGLQPGIPSCGQRQPWSGGLLTAQRSQIRTSCYFWDSPLRIKSLCNRQGSFARTLACVAYSVHRVCHPPICANQSRRAIPRRSMSSASR